MPGSNSETWGRFCHGFDSGIVGSITTLYGQITAREYMGRWGNQVHPMIQTLFPNSDAVFQDDNACIHTAGTAQPRFEDHEGKLKHFPWPVRSPDLNVIEPLWSVLETRMMNRFPPPTSLKQLEYVIQEEIYKIPRETVPNLYESIPRRITAVLKAKRSPTPY
jgi:hypothetical protein